MAAVALAVLAVLLILRYAGDGQDQEPGTTDVNHTPSVADPGRSQARLVVSGGTNRLTVTSAGLGGDLVRAQTPDTQRAVPILSEDEPGTVRVTTQARDNAGGDGVDLTVRLSSDVQWEITVDGGSSLLRLDLAQARVQSIDVSQGMTSIEADLPRPDGVLRTRIGGGVGAVRVLLPAEVPVQATFSAGAGGANLDGVQHGGLAAGAVLTAPDQASHAEVWSSPNRLELAVDSGIGSLNLARKG